MLSVKSVVRSACAVGGAVVLLASGASAAVAAPAVFSSTGGTVALPSTTNPISLSFGPAPWQNRTCVQGTSYGTASISNTAGQGALSLNLNQATLTCTDGLGASFQTWITSQAGSPALASGAAGSYSLTSQRLLVWDNGAPGLTVDTTPVSFTVPFTNGTTGVFGANPSTITFSNTLVSYAVDHRYGNGWTVSPVRLSGSIKLGTGVALTLS